MTATAQAKIAAPHSRNSTDKRMAARPRKEQPEHVRGTPAGLFGERLAQLMERSGVTVKELADAIGKSEDSVWGYLRGTATPPINVWPAIAAKLGVKDARSLLPKLPGE